MKETPPSGCALCFDFGTTKTGAAAGNTITGTAQPIGIIKAQTNEARWRGIDELASEWQPDFFVVGLPRLADGSLSDWGRRCERFARQLEGRYRRRVYLCDERYSSVEVESGEDEIDDLSACVILEQFLNSIEK